jgi:Flp pilus assembly protein TadD
LSIPGAFLAAIIFALHPVNVQSVAWISQRKNMMAMLFFLLSILWYLKFFGLAPPRLAAKLSMVHRPLPADSSFIPHPSSFYFWYWLSLAAFALAMLSKASAVTLPVLLLGIAWWLHTKGTVQIFMPTKMGLSPNVRRDLVLTAPFFAVAVALTVVNVWFQTHGMDIAYRTVSFAERLLGAGGVIWFYLYKALLPLNLVFVYPQWRVEAGNPLWWLPLATILAVTAVLWRYRNGWSRQLLFAWGFFCVALAPALGLKDVGFMEHSLVADHYQHIAIIGVIVLISAGFCAWHRLSRSESHRATALAVAAVGVFAFLTWRQSGLYRDAITLYQATLEKNPESWMVQNNLGLELEKAGRPRDAINYYREALQLKPNYPEAHYNWGFALVKLGSLPEAIEQYEQALKLKSDYSQAHNNLGIVLHKMGRLQESIDQFQLALRSKSDLPETHNNLGIALVQTGRHQEAIEHYREAIRLKPDYDKAYFNLGNAYKAVEQNQEAIENYRKALELARTHGQTDLARQIEDVLNSYRTGPVNSPNSPSDSQSPPPPP